MVEATRPDGQQAHQAHQALPCIRVKRTHGRSTDGHSAAIELEAVDGKRFLIEVSAEQLAAIRNAFAELTRESRTLIARGQDNVFPQMPQTFTIAESPGMRSCVLLVFDSGMGTENVIAIPDAKALEFAAAIEHNVVARMTPEERLTHGQRKNGKQLALPPGRKLILPPGHS